MSGHNVSIAAGGPSPGCQHPECHRRAQLMYVSKVTGLKVYRPWCRPHRPSAPITVEHPRPRVYLPANQAWPADVKCPWCDKAREPRGDGPRRPTCRYCRHRGTPPPPPAPARPKRRSKPRAAVKSPATRRPTAPTFDPFTYRDGGRIHKIAVVGRDATRLRSLFKKDVGHYAAGTDKKLTQRYPTAMISALWAQWASFQE